MDRPTGVTVLGILYILAGIVGLGIAVIIGVASSTFMGGMMAGIGVIGGAIAGFVLIGAIIDFVIAGALFSGKSWGRILVIVFAIIDLILNAISLLGFNVVAIVFIILDLIVLYYMWRPHVVAYFKGGFSGSTWVCEHCNWATTTEADLINHKNEKHLDKSPYVCEHCEFIGKTEEELWDHYNDKHPGKKKW